MELEQITPKWIGACLDAARKHEPLPDEVQELQCVTGTTRQDREPAFTALLHERIIHQITQRRQSARLTPIDGSGPDVERQNIAQDAQQTDNRLKIWSFLYYRYVSNTFSVKEMAGFAKYSSDYHRVLIRQGYALLADYVQACESAARADQRHMRLRARLGEQEYVEYIGMDEVLEKLVNRLRDPDGPRWISLEGLGGIGKTALARRISEEITRQDADTTVIWLSARQRRFDPSRGIEMLSNAALTAGELTDQLWQSAALTSDEVLTVKEKIQLLIPWCRNFHGVIVIDNLETVLDVKAMEYFQPLAEVGRFVLTSRESLRHLPYVMSYTVPELTLKDGEALLRREYQARKTQLLSKTLSADQLLKKDLTTIPLTSAHFDVIRDTVGGSPLALKLIAAQILTMPIDECLAGLQNASQQKRTEEMFTFIYRQTWRLLSVKARLFLLAIHDTLPPEGSPREWLAAMAGAADLLTDEFDTVIEALRYYSLLDVEIDKGLYRLHRLTVTFLQNEFRHANPREA